MEFEETKKLQVINRYKRNVSLFYYYLYTNRVQLISQKRNENKKMKKIL